MKFNDFHPSYDNYRETARRAGIRHIESERELFHRLMQMSPLEQVDHNYAVAEHWWYEDDRPYYDLYPALAKAFLKLRLDAPMSAVDLRPPHGLKSLLIRLPTDLELIRADVSHVIGSLLVTVIEGQGLMVTMDYGEVTDGFCITEYCSIRFDEHPTMEQALDMWERVVGERRALGKIDGVLANSNAVRDSFRIAIACILLSDDPDVIEPLLLNKDADKPVTPELVDRARRRGKVGWSVGRHVETSPHWRNPHFCWQAHGENWSKRRLIMRAGSLVNKHEVPTGYLDRD